MIPDDVVEEVRARADIVDVVSEFVPDLKKSGKDYKAKCPFHEDRTPSFYVVPAKGFYKCFGCGESGDAFTFVMKKVGLDFVEAVKYVGARCGVDVQEVRRERPEDDPFRPMYEANSPGSSGIRRQERRPGSTSPPGAWGGIPRTGSVSVSPRTSGTRWGRLPVTTA
jgi:DNA primase catalytic core